MNDKQAENHGDNDNDAATKEDLILKKLDKLQREVWYNRITMAIFLVVALFYINLKVDNLGSVLGTLIEMFMP